VTISEAARDKLKQLQDLLAHQIPNGDPAPIIERALDVLLTQVHKRKTGATDKPRAPRATSDTPVAPSAPGRRTPKAAVRRKVWPRDEGRCGFVGDDGRRCNETRGLEFAHKVPWAKGGADTADNFGLRCIAHNAYEAERDYGASHMANKRRRKVPTKPLKVREPVARYVYAHHDHRFLNLPRFGPLWWTPKMD
jgi:5-methylcytosine-specific restriction endonuclease McrA